MNGIYTAMVTAFNEDGSVNEPGVREIVRHNVEHCQTRGLFVGGTMGERFKMSVSSVKELLHIVSDEVAGRVDLVANITALGWEDVLDLATYAKQEGYSKVSLIPPVFHQYSNEEIVLYYEFIADRVELPLMIYVIPSFSKVEFTEGMLVKLLQHPNIVGFKFTHNDYYLLDRVRVKCPEAILFTGFDDVLYHALMMGTDGAIGGTFNLTGLLAGKLYDAVMDKDFDTALKYQRNINDVEDMLNETGLTPTIKATLEVMGIHCGQLKLPSATVTETQMAQGRRIAEYLERNGG